MQLAGASNVRLRPGFAMLSRDVTGAKERDTYLPVSLETNAKGSLIATPLKWSGSSDFIGFARATALAIIPAGKKVERDAPAKILYL
jgi:molybdopterin biosynthesis enzyme